MTTKQFDSKKLAGGFRAKIDWMKHGAFSNPFEQDTGEWVGYENEQYETELLGDLLNEQNGSMGI